MKIVKEDQNVLVLQKNYFIWYLMGIFFLILGFFMLFKPDLFAEKPDFWVGSLFILGGGLTVAFLNPVTITLDKTQNKIIFSLEGLIGRTTKEYKFDDVKNVKIYHSYSSTNGRGGYSKHLAFVFKNGESVDLLPGYSSGYGLLTKLIASEKELGKRIATFLNIPFEEKPPLTKEETISLIETTIQEGIKKELEKQNKLNSPS